MPQPPAPAEVQALTLNRYLLRIVAACVVPLLLLIAAVAADDVQSLQQQRADEVARRAEQAMHAVRAVQAELRPAQDRAAAFAALLQQLALPPGWHLALIGDTGEVMASHPKAPSFASPHNLGWLKAAPGPRHVSLPVAPSNWQVVLHVDAWPFYQPAAQMLGVQLGVLALALAGAVLYMRHSGRRLSLAVDRMILRPPLVDSPPAKGTLRIAEIERAREEMQRLDAAQHAAQEGERRRVARELHDGLQQDLARLQIDLDLTIAQLKRAEPTTANATAGRLAEQSREATRAVIADLDDIVNDLRPRVLDELGLTAALEQLTGQFSRSNHIDVEFEAAGPPAVFASLSLAVSSGVYRIAQESLNNVRKHAQAGFVYLLLDAGVPGQLTLRVSDDGVGLVPGDAARRDSHGLLGMAERVAALGGSLCVERSKDLGMDSGTTILAAVPVTA